MEQYFVQTALTHASETIVTLIKTPNPLKPFEMFLIYKSFLFGSNDGSKPSRKNFLPEKNQFDQFINVIGISVISAFFTKIVFMFGSTFTTQDAPKYFKQLRRQILTYILVYVFGWSISFLIGALRKCQGIINRKFKKNTIVKAPFDQNFLRSNAPVNLTGINTPGANTPGANTPGLNKPGDLARVNMPKTVQNVFVNKKNIEVEKQNFKLGMVKID